MKWTSHMSHFTLYEAFRVCLNFKLKFTYHSVATKHIFRDISYLEKLYKTSFTLDKYFVKLQKKKAYKDHIYFFWSIEFAKKKIYMSFSNKNCYRYVYTKFQTFIKNTFNNLHKFLGQT